jgi:hypothetical protein
VSRYLVGIDLGTTHTVVAYADGADGEIEIFEIDQLVAPGEVAARPLLPSMRYHPALGQLAEGDRELPWSAQTYTGGVRDAVLGELTRELGSKVPGRLVTSAKSWLSHPAVERTAAILPWGAPEGVARISPLDASASYLAYVRSAWCHRFPNHSLEAQEIVLTVPASFDEVARTLTVEAAHRAGLPRVHLVEEPQAACYDWMARHREQLAADLGQVRLLLVCDVGGGTTDLTLIEVRSTPEGPRLLRIGVGEHLMLGGDNMDLALAHLAEARLTSSGKRLNAAQLSQLAQQCRGAKERLLDQQAPDSTSVTVLGTGARLIGESLSTRLTREEAEQLVVEGFFPEIGPGELPHRRRAGIVEFGLPYASDPAVTRHLAAFLSDHAHAARTALADRAPPDDGLAVPDAVLLNGGVFNSAILAERLLGVLAAWRGDQPMRLHNEHPELAVARGAVASAMARRGRGPRIGGGSARSFVMLVEDQTPEPQRGVCLLPRGTEEGHEIRLSERVFSLRLGQPVRFHLMASTGDRTYAPGDLVDIDPEHFRPLPPIATVLGHEGGEGTGEVRVQLAAMLTDVGTLEIDCVAADDAPLVSRQRWRLEFQLRGQTVDQIETRSTELHPAFPQAAQRIHRVFGPRMSDVAPQDSKRLPADLERLLGRREDWDPHLLRELFAIVWEGMRRRRRSAEHERLWFNLAGYCLRPGYGYPLDDWRVEQLGSLYEPGVQYKPQARNWAEWWTMWRRVAGGLSDSWQLRILHDIEPHLRPDTGRGGRGVKPPAYDDMVRLAARLERLPAERKVQVGEWLVGTRRTLGESPQRWWALGRLGARVLFYGSAHHVVPREHAGAWLERVLALDWRSVSPAAFAATQLARLSGDRERDLEADARARVAARLRQERAPAKWVKMVQEVTELDSADETRVFGESLPPGLRLVH